MSASSILPCGDRLTIGFAHSAYSLGQEFARRDTGLNYFEVKDAQGLSERIGDADVLVTSGLWKNGYLERTRRLRFIQSVSAGTDQYDIAALRRAGVRLASAAGVNQVAVSEHALALMLALNRQLHLARDNQREGRWYVGDPGIANRPGELAGQTILVVGLGAIGGRVASLAHGLGMRVLGVSRTPRLLPGGEQGATMNALNGVLAQADFVVLTCPLNDSTRGLIGAPQFAAMKSTAVLINVARGPVVVEAALVEALQSGRLRAAGLDCFEQEPLPAESPLWGLRNVLTTAHIAGETPLYETRVIDTLLENLGRLQRGETALKNQVA